jgi:hypothetical protein
MLIFAKVLVSTFPTFKRPNVRSPRSAGSSEGKRVFSPKNNVSVYSVVVWSLTRWPLYDAATLRRAQPGQVIDIRIGRRERKPWRTRNGNGLGVLVGRMDCYALGICRVDGAGDANPVRGIGHNISQVSELIGSPIKGSAFAIASNPSRKRGAPRAFCYLLATDVFALYATFDEQNLLWSFLKTEISILATNGRTLQVANTTSRTVSHPVPSDRGQRFGGADSRRPSHLFFLASPNTCEAITPQFSNSLW